MARSTDRGGETAERGDSRTAPGSDAAPQDDDPGGAARAALAGRPLVLVGLMGVGKTTIGRQVAGTLGLPFTDADEEIERVSRMTVSELFEQYGEAEFRALERRVIERLLDGAPIVLATGGGAFMNPDTRAAMRERAVSLWLRAELDVLVERTARRNTRPLLRTGNPRDILARLMRERHPVYAEADLTVDSTRDRQGVIAGRVIHALAAMARADGRVETGVDA